MSGNALFSDITNSCINADYTHIINTDGSHVGYLSPNCSSPSLRLHDPSSHSDAVSILNGRQELWTWSVGPCTGFFINQSPCVDSGETVTLHLPSIYMRRVHVDAIHISLRLGIHNSKRACVGRRGCGAVGTCLMLHASAYARSDDGDGDATKLSSPYASGLVTTQRSVVTSRLLRGAGLCMIPY